MSERVTQAMLEVRAENLNRRLRGFTDPMTHIRVESRNGHVALDEYRGNDCIRMITVGTKREVADFLHAMMVGIDLFNRS